MTTAPSRARSAPRNPHRPGPHGRQKCGPSRTVTLTDAGRETLRLYRQRLALEAIEAGDTETWVRCHVGWMAGASRYEWRRREVAP